MGQAVTAAGIATSVFVICAFAASVHGCVPDSHLKTSSDESPICSGSTGTAHDSALDSRVSLTLVTMFSLFIVGLLAVVVCLDCVINLRERAREGGEGESHERTLAEFIRDEQRSAYERKVLKLRALDRAQRNAQQQQNGSLACERATDEKCENRVNTQRSHSNELASKCTICQEDFLQCANRTIQLSCGHSFHERCVARWAMQFETSPSACPMCRTPISI